jgi:hypothetical protein
MPKPVAFVLIVIVCGALDIVLHMLTADFLSPLERYSLLVERFGLGPVAMVWVALAFTGLGLVFLRIERHMTGSAVGKGLRYGLAVGLMVQVAMIEGVAMLGNRFVDELVTGLADAIPILLMAVLMGRFLASDGPSARSVEPLPAGFLRVVVVLAAVYGVGRLGAQWLGLFNSALVLRPLATVAWTLTMGGAIGVLVWLVRDAASHLAPFAQALTLGVGVFGVNWALFMAFVPMVFADALADSVQRVSVDIALVTIACALAVGVGRAREAQPSGAAMP